MLVVSGRQIGTTRGGAIGRCAEDYFVFAHLDIVISGAVRIAPELLIVMRAIVFASYISCFFIEDAACRWVDRLGASRQP